MARMNIATDKDDYQPGEVVLITASDIKPGGTAYFTLAHLIDAGADGVSGTQDDVVAYDLTGTGSWAVVDGGAGDLDGLANGVIVTSWEVNPDAAYQEFYLSAERVLPNGKPAGDAAITTFTDTPQPPQAGSIAWEKRDEAGILQGGATFEIRNATTNALIKTVVDNGLNDADPDAGQILVTGIAVGSYNVIETVAPTGYALDDDPTRLVTVSSGALNQVIGSALGAPPGTDDPGNTDESDFHNRLGSIAWEKRDETGALQGGATFEISPDPSDGVGVMTVVDNGANDADPDAGQILVQNVLLGTYTITETVAPTGYALDDDPTREVTVSSGDLNAVVGTQGSDQTGNTDESDFHNIPIPPEPGNGATPGFWKGHVDIVNEELGEYQPSLSASSFYETVFSVTLNGPASFNPTLLEALEARGSGPTGADGQGALLRHSTAAFIAAASDAVDEDGAGPQDNLNFSFAGLSSDPSYNLLLLIDLNDDLKLSPEEVINAVQDVYNDADADTNFLGLLGQPGKQDLANAFAAMNNQPHLDPSAF